MKLMIHELKAAIALRPRRIASTRASRSSRASKLIQKQLFEQWAVLETLTPSEYEAFRPVLGTLVRIPVGAIPRARVPARQQAARRWSTCSATTPAIHAELDRAARRRRRLYDEFLRHLARRGLPVPARVRRARLVATARAQSGAGSGVQDDLRRSRALVGCVRDGGEAGRRRGVVPALALPPPEDGRADRSATRPAPAARRVSASCGARSTTRSFPS